MKKQFLLKAAYNAAFTIVIILPNQSSASTSDQTVLYVRSATLASSKVKKRFTKASGITISDEESLERIRQLSYLPGSQSQAVEKFSSLLNRNPDNWQARYSRALTLAWMKRFPESFADFKKILAVQPNLSIDVQEVDRKRLPVQVAYAEALVWSGSIEEAAAVYERYLSDNPKDRKARFDFALALRSIPHNRAASIEQFDICIQQAPDFRQAILSKAITLGWMNHYDLALAILSPFKAEDPIIKSDNIRVLLAIAQLHNWSGRTADSAALYKEYLLKYPGDNVGKVEYAEILSTMPEHREEALAIFSNLIAHTPHDAKAQFGAAQSLAWLGKKEESLARFQKAVEIAPGDLAGRKQFAVFLISQQRNSDALSQLAEAERLAPDDIEVLNLKGQCLIDVGEFIAAESTFSSIVAAQPDNWTARIGLAEALYHRQEIEQGNEHFRSALRLSHSPTQVEAAAQRLSADPDLAPLKLLLAQDALGSSFKTLPIESRGDSNSLLKLGESLIYSDETRAQGIDCLTRSLELDPDNRSAKALLAETLSWGKQKKLSLAMFQELTSTDHSNLTLRSKQAAVLSWTGKLKMARREYSEILATDPNNRLALLGLGSCYSWQGDYLKAESILSKVDSKYPRDPEVIIARALNYRDMGRVDLADKQLDKFDSHVKLAIKNKTSLSMSKGKASVPNSAPQ